MALNVVPLAAELFSPHNEATINDSAVSVVMPLRIWPAAVDVFGVPLTSQGSPVVIAPR